MQTRSQYRRELELRYDGPIPAHLKASCDSGAYPAHETPDAKDIEKFCDWLQGELRAKFGGISASANLEYSTISDDDPWTLALHARGINESDCELIQGRLEDVWSQGLAFAFSDFNAASLAPPA